MFFDITIDLFDVLLLLMFFLAVGSATYLLNYKRKTNLEKLIESDTIFILDRINDLDNAIADLKREIEKKD